jgi:ferredoxin
MYRFAKFPMAAEGAVQATLSGVEDPSLSEVKLTVVDRAGGTHHLICEAGNVLMHVLRDNIDVDIGICGGEISCGTCLVKLNREWFASIAAASEGEQEMLDALDATDHARLGCQLVLDEKADGMQATLLHEE